MVIWITCVDLDPRPSDDLPWRTAMILPMRLSSWQCAANPRACLCERMRRRPCRYSWPDFWLVLQLTDRQRHRPQVSFHGARAPTRMQASADQPGGMTPGSQGSDMADQQRLHRRMPRRRRRLHRPSSGERADDWRLVVTRTFIWLTDTEAGSSKYREQLGDPAHIGASATSSVPVQVSKRHDLA